MRDLLERFGSLAIDWIGSIHLAQLASFSVHIRIDINSIEVSDACHQCLKSISPYGGQFLAVSVCSQVPI